MFPWLLIMKFIIIFKNKLLYKSLSSIENHILLASEDFLKYWIN
jgi:hypothetical protein